MKMTVKQTLEQFLLAWNSNAYLNMCTSDDMKNAIESMEKQIPKTPCIEGDGYADGILVYDIWICPNCEKVYEIDYDDYDYCPECGQKIDKTVFEESEEDEKRGNR